MEVTGAYKLQPGARPPAFDLPATDGRRRRLDDFAASPVLVVAWWCNHCPYVRAWEERTIAIARAFAPRGVAVVAISSNDPTSYPSDDFARMTERAAEQAYPFPYLLDESQDVAHAYGAQVTPHFFVFARRHGEHRLAYQGRLDDSKDAPSGAKATYLRDAIEAALEGREAPVRETPALGCSVKWRA